MPRHPTQLLSSFGENSKILKKIDIFLKILDFFKISGNLEPHQSGAGICFLTFYYIILIFNKRSIEFSLQEDPSEP